MKKLDRNGYGPSIYPDPWPTDGMVRHEIYFGHKCRRISKRAGFWVYLTPYVHMQLHANEGTGVDIWLKKDCQRRYEQSHTREEFVKLIGRNYL